MLRRKQKNSKIKKILILNKKKAFTKEILLTIFLIKCRQQQKKNAKNYETKHNAI